MDMYLQKITKLLLIEANLHKVPSLYFNLILSGIFFIFILIVFFSISRKIGRDIASTFSKLEKLTIRKFDTVE